MIAILSGAANSIPHGRSLFCLPCHSHAPVNGPGAVENYCPRITLMRAKRWAGTRVMVTVSLPSPLSLTDWV